MDMTIELYALLATALLILALAFTASTLYGKQVGNPALMGNREQIEAPTGAAQRAVRAHLNLLENAVPFAIVVLTAQVLHVSTPMTQAAALVFIIVRVAHAAVYIAGITGARTLLWLAGVASTVAIGLALIG